MFPITLAIDRYGYAILGLVFVSTLLDINGPFYLYTPIKIYLYYIRAMSLMISFNS